MRVLNVLHLTPTLILGLKLPWVFLQDPNNWYGQVDIKVPVQLGVMSRCPDAQLCENKFDKVLKRVAEKVDLSLVYVATFDPSEPDFGIKCMHGAQECAGNVQQLCVAKYEPFSVWWNFIKCQNNAGRENIGNASLALECAEAVGINWEASRTGLCTGLDGSGKGYEGVGLLKESVALGQKLGIEKSCTVLINGRQVCVHDDTWKKCKNGHTVHNFVQQINDEYDHLNHAGSII